MRTVDVPESPTSRRASPDSVHTGQPCAAIPGHPCFATFVQKVIGREVALMLKRILEPRCLNCLTALSAAQGVREVLETAFGPMIDMLVEHWNGA